MAQMSVPSPGNYPQALEDFQECLCLQLKHLPPHHRLLAETHYHIATILYYMDKYSQAIQHYNSSIEVIEKRLGEDRNSWLDYYIHGSLGNYCPRLEMLQEAIAKPEGEDGETKKELEELNRVLPEIREKIEDVTDSQRTASGASQAIQQALVSTCTRRNSKKHDLRVWV